MEIPSINNSAAGATTDRVPIQTLGQDDFLKLLVTQLTSQDPLNPQKDTEFIAQMAQFSALEQSRAMQHDVARLYSDQQFLRANSLLGREVTVQSGEDELATGAVSAIHIQAGTPMLIINGQPFELSAVLTIAPEPAQTTPR